MEQAIKNIDVKALAVAEFSKFETDLMEFKERYDDVVYDLTDEDQEKQARSDRLTIGKVISSLDTKHKELKAPLKVKTDLIDGERKRIKDGLQGVQDKIKSQIKAHEQQIADHAEILHNKVEDIRALAVFEGIVRQTADQIAERLEQVKAINVDESFEHRQADGTFAQVQVIKELEGLFAYQVNFEAEQAELERLRQQAAKREQTEREEQIRKDAEQKAKLEAEEAAQAVIDEAARKQQKETEEKEKQRVKYYESMIKHINQCAHGFIGGEPQSFGILFYELNDKIIIDDSWGEFEAPAIEARSKALSTLKKLQEIARLKTEDEEKRAAERKQLEAKQVAETAAQTERNRIENERLDAQEKKLQRKAKEEAKKATQKHRGKIHGEAKQCLMDNGFDATEAGVIVSLIKDGKIKNIQVNY